MPGSTIPDGVRRFLLGVIPSVPHLEALLLLRARPNDTWTLAQLGSRLYTDPDTTAALVADLVAAELATSGDDTCRYAPRDPQVAATVDSVAELYARRMVMIAELIHSTSDGKALRFADAFRLRKES